jgi:uncharacterized damage-inducible protein DinB
VIGLGRRGTGGGFAHLREDTVASIAELLTAELDRELPGTRRALERIPEGQNGWKPHPRSMELGYLAALVATMPGWIVSMIEAEYLDLASPGRYGTAAFPSTAALLAAFDREAAAARAAVAGARDDHLLTTSWQLRRDGQVLLDQPRYQAVRDGALNHLYHHRGQLTVYLRLNEKLVPSLYGPSADEQYPS